MSELALDQPVGAITVGDLRKLMREVTKEEKSYYIDEEGCRVFLSEDAYADYLDKQEGKLPSEVRAYFIDEQGYKAFYSDWAPTLSMPGNWRRPGKNRRLMPRRCGTT